MVYQLGSALLDACVLSVLASGDAYGYQMTQQVRSVMEVSESTLYPVLRRLQKDGALETYDEPFEGRNRRYYRLTAKGREMTDFYRKEWVGFKEKIDELLLEGNKDDTE